MLKNFFGRKHNADYDVILSEIEAMYLRAPVDFGGGCSFEKALTLSLFIKELNLKTSADIGVYRGRSLFPQALSHKKNTNGIVYAIDPYDNIAAIQNDKPEIKEKLDEFAENTDFSKIFQEVVSIINDHDLNDHCEFIRMKSEDAKSFFVSENIQLGLVHIDGNHDTKFVLKDVDDYVPLIIRGGVIVLDDISWDSVKPALAILNKTCKLLGTIIDDTNDFAVFIKDGSAQQNSASQKLFDSVKNHKYPKNRK